MKDINLIDKSHLIESNTIKNTKKTEEFLDSLKNIRFIVNDVSGISVDKLDITGFNVDQDIIDKLKKGITPTKAEIISGAADEYIWSYGLYKSATVDEKPTWDKIIKDNGITDILKAYNSMTSSLEIVGDGKTETFTIPNENTFTDRTNIRNIIYANELSDYVIPFADQRDGGPSTKRRETMIPMIPTFGPSKWFELLASDDNTCGLYVRLFMFNDFITYQCTVVDFVDIFVNYPGIVTKGELSTIYVSLEVEEIGSDGSSLSFNVSFNINVDPSGKVSVSDFNDEQNLWESSGIGIALAPTEDSNRKRIKLLFSSFLNTSYYFNVKYSFSTISGNAFINILDRHKISTAFRLCYETFGYSDNISKYSKYFVNTENIDEFAGINILDGQPEVEDSVVAVVKKVVSDVRDGNFYHVGGNRNAR